MNTEFNEFFDVEPEGQVGAEIEYTAEPAEEGDAASSSGGGYAWNGRPRNVSRQRTSCSRRWAASRV